MNTAIDLNHNLAQCIKTQSSWGHDVFFNICNHTQTMVPWGGMDYVGPVVGAAFLVMAGTVVATMLVALGKDIYDYYSS